MTTKFNIGNEVHTLSENKVVVLRIKEIIIYEDGDIRYKLHEYPSTVYTYRFENQIFATKEELLKSL